MLTKPRIAGFFVYEIGAGGVMDVLSKIDWLHIVYAVFVAVLGFFIARQVGAIVGKAVSKRFSRHLAVLSRRLIFYGLFLLFLISALQQIGFKMTVLLGAAGVFTVALSFASQTAASNLVSGIFLLFESPFKVGDTIRLKDMAGVVDSMDLLSTKIKTADNMRIRIPNETIMKSDIINMSYFKTRRVDMLIGVSYNTEIEHVKHILLTLLKAHPDVLQEPAMQVVINQFTDSAIELKLMFWAETGTVNQVKYELYEQIKQVFDKEGIEMPYRQMSLPQA
ncbi:mechanosensitive ion channel family protein [Legionella londiniensis]|nr:mechanosensitive ion channel family protein [Legionella londiniensis]